jgi:hypothetical protein
MEKACLSQCPPTYCNISYTPPTASIGYQCLPCVWFTPNVSLTAVNSTLVFINFTEPITVNGTGELADYVVLTMAVASTNFTSEFYDYSVIQVNSASFMLNLTYIPTTTGSLPERWLQVQITNPSVVIASSSGFALGATGQPYSLQIALENFWFPSVSQESEISLLIEIANYIIYAITMSIIFLLITDDLCLFL